MIRRELTAFWQTVMARPSPADVASVVRATPVGAGVSALNAIVFALAYGPAVDQDTIAVWCFATVMLCVFVLRRAWRARKVTVRTVSARAVRMLGFTSILLAIPWTVLSVAVLPQSSDMPRLVALILCTGMMTCGAVMLQRTLLAALLYVAMVNIGVIIGCVMAGVSDTYVLVLYNILCGAFICYSAYAAGKTARERDVMLGELSEANAQLEVANDQISTLAFADPVTGLSNRKAFYDELADGVARGTTPDAWFAVLLLDLDNFKNINDSYGHNFGDELLNTIGQRINAILASTGAVARLGGDEFAILVRGADVASAAVTFGEKVIEAIAAPVDLGGRQIEPTTSIGVALYPEHATNPTELLVRADIALAHAKDQGKARVSLFDEAMSARLTRDNEIATEMRKALAADGLSVNYQPKVCLKTGALKGAEALIRWQHPTLGLIGPDQFLPIASDRGMMQLVSDFVFRRVAQDVATWKAVGVEIGKIAINIHPLALKSPEHLLQSINEQKVFGVGPEDIALEITEGCFVGRGTEAAPMILDALSERGYHLSLDDFGTGHAALTHLRSLPVQEIKIDKSFVSSIEFSQSDRAIVSATIAIAKGMGLQSVAEGVETKAQLDVLCELGADIGQGYYWAKPLPSEEFLDFAQTINGPPSFDHGGWVSV